MSTSEIVSLKRAKLLSLNLIGMEVRMTEKILLVITDRVFQVFFRTVLIGG